jgi:hypothetical protein
MYINHPIISTVLTMSKQVSIQKMAFQKQIKLKKNGVRIISLKEKRILLNAHTFRSIKNSHLLQLSQDM